jgi:hypothetical protein
MAGSSTSLCLYCKSYEGDVRRVALLLESISRFNRDGLKFYVSVPALDRALFASRLGRSEVELINDEDIVRANPRVAPQRYASWDGRLSQQVIKSEFWRLVPGDSYVCIDSDSLFLRDFYQSDFLHPDHHPYTVMHQAKDFLQLAIDKGKDKVAHEFYAGSRRMKDRFGRTGPDHAFGPTPVIWSRMVWKDLDDQFLAPNGLTLWEAIAREPCELRWYGEALLKFASIPLHPIEPLFRVYHYDWQWHALKAMGETHENLARNFLGVVYQSNWRFELDAGTKTRPPLSRILRRAKRWLAQFR